MKIGIDVGGSHVGVGIVDDNHNLILKKEKDYIKKENDMSNTVINTIIELIDQIKTEKQIDISNINLVGVAFPGTISNGIVIKADNLGIKNLKIKEILERKLRIPVYIQNDAKCAAIAEKQKGSLRNYDDALFLVIGTGIGGATFLNGELLIPKRYSGFEVGHMVINQNGNSCTCGRKGCFESYASIKRLKDEIKKEFNLEYSVGKQIKEFIIYNIDNSKMQSIIDTYIKFLWLGIANLINIFEPEAITLGGSFAYYREVLLPKLEKQLLNKHELFNKESPPKILIAELGNDAGIIGATLINKK